MSAPIKKLSDLQLSDNIKFKIQEILDETGYPLVQENGQRIYGPPPKWSAPPPEPGSEVFLSNIPRECFEDELIPFFSALGRIYKFRLMMDFSGSNRGYAFITYVDKNEAMYACYALQSICFRSDVKICATQSFDNRRLYVGNIAKSVTEKELLTEIQKLVEGLESVVVVPDRDKEKMNRGYGFLIFRTHVDAANARRVLIPNNIVLWHQKIKVDWAVPNESKSLFVMNVRNIPEQVIGQTFKAAVGAEAIVEICKKNEVAFIHFNKKENAKKARRLLNGTILHTNKLVIFYNKINSKQCTSEEGSVTSSSSDTKSSEDYHSLKEAEKIIGNNELVQDYYTVPSLPINNYGDQCLEYQPYGFDQEVQQVQQYLQCNMSQETQPPVHPYRQQYFFHTTYKNFQDMQHQHLIVPTAENMNDNTNHDTVALEDMITNPTLSKIFMNLEKFGNTSLVYAICEVNKFGRPVFVSKDAGANKFGIPLYTYCAYIPKLSAGYNYYFESPPTTDLKYAEYLCVQEILKYFASTFKTAFDAKINGIKI